MERLTMVADRGVCAFGRGAFFPAVHGRMLGGLRAGIF